MPQGTSKRKLAAILNADVVGYGRLMAGDEAATITALNESRAVFRERIEARGGRVVDTAGDSVLAEFRSVVEAVECAVEVQGALTARNAPLPEDRRMLFRIGVNLGDVIEQKDGTIYGDGVNIAARLESLAEPGGICVSDEVRRQVGNKLDIGFTAMGEQVMKNIAEPVVVHKVLLNPDELEEAPDVRAKPTGMQESDRPSVAVLPFDNMSGDPEQQYFSDGITEDIITELSRFHSLVVIARNSSFAFRGMAIDVKEIGKNLGVHFVVEGSVRKSDTRVRVTVQLIDAATGHHLWAERYDRKLEDIFAVQDEITQAIVTTLPGRMEEAGWERARRKRNPDMTAYDYVLLGLDRFNRFSREDNVQARRYSQMAIDRDPLFARAHALLAASHLWDLYMYAQDDNSLDKAFKSAESALALDDEDSWSRGMLGLVHFLRRQDEESEIQFRRAISLNQNNADTIAFFGNVLVYLGRWEEGLDCITKARRLNPFPPEYYHWYHALALYSAREYGRAIHSVKQIRLLDRWHHGLLAMCYAQMGRSEEAGVELRLLLEAPRGEAIAKGDPLPTEIHDLVFERANRYRIEADRDHFLAGLRKAGLPV